MHAVKPTWNAFSTAGKVCMRLSCRQKYWKYTQVHTHTNTDTNKHTQTHTHTNKLTHTNRCTAGRV